jgi:hypothetical protein
MKKVPVSSVTNKPSPSHIAQTLDRREITTVLNAMYPPKPIAPSVTRPLNIKAPHDHRMMPGADTPAIARPVTPVESLVPRHIELTSASTVAHVINNLGNNQENV